MLSPDFVHEQLKQDCHILGFRDNLIVLLHRNALIPWFIVVPFTTQQSFLFLTQKEQNAILSLCGDIARFLEHKLACPRHNFASIGNIVAQLHIHLIGRREQDECWPLPVWGHLKRFQEYEPEQVTEIFRGLHDSADLLSF